MHLARRALQHDAAVVYAFEYIASDKLEAQIRSLSSRWSSTHVANMLVLFVTLSQNGFSLPFQSRVLTREYFRCAEPQLPDSIFHSFQRPTRCTKH